MTKYNKVKKDFNLYKELFLSTLSISAFTVGGGYVIVPLMKERFVDNLAWIDEEEMLDMIAIAQSTPGAIAVNTSMILGYKIGGIFGAFCTILATMLPPLIIISIISLFYTYFKDNKIIISILKGMQIGVVALIADVVINMSKTVYKKLSYFGLYTMLSMFIFSFILKINLIYIIFISAILGILRAYYISRKIKKLKESTRL